MTRIFLAATLISMTLIAPVSASQFPWLNSNIIGSITPEYSPSVRDDFYVSVNREWLTTAKLKPGYATNAAFTELQDILDARLKDLMTSPDLAGHDADLVKALYSLWLDWPSRNAEGLSELKAIADHITTIKTIDELSEYLMSTESLYHNIVIADYGLGRDNKDSESYNLELGAAGLSLGDSAEYRELTPNGARTKKMHDSIVLYMLRRLGYDEPDAQRLIDSAFEFEKAIAPNMMTHEEINSPEAIERMYNPLTLEELRKKSPVFPYADLLLAHKAESKLMNLQEPEWLKRLNELYTADNLENMKAYLLCNVAGSYITVTDEPAYREYQRLARERYGITGSKPDDELAVNFVHGRLSVPVSRLYIARHVPKQAKIEVEQIIRDTVNYYREMLKSESWMSEATRAKAIEKLSAMRLNAAYPDKWVDYSDLEINPNGTLLEALMALRKFSLKKYFYDRLNTKVDHDLWINDVVVVNAYYRPSENSINIIAGIIGGEFYGPEMSYEEKLGGIGSVIGHEISHAFDTNGAQFDKTGNVNTWWTDEDYKAFQARADRLIKYFDTMRVDPDGTKYNGRLVQTEVIADMAGIKAMLGIAEGHANFDYDKFFRSFARIWRTIHTRERNDMLVKVDVHALAYLRVNATLQQYGKFYECYGIQNGDGMYLPPEERVAVW